MTSRRIVGIVVALLLGTAALAGCGQQGTWNDPQLAGNNDPSTPSAAPSSHHTDSATTFTLSAVGDTLMANAPAYVPADDGKQIFADLTDDLHSDLQMANLEEPLANSSTSNKCGADLGKTCFAYRAPTAFAQTLHDAGFDLVNIANNHLLDQGPSGRTSTENALTAAGVKFTGPPGVITMTTVKGVKIAVVGFAPYSWANNLINISACAKLIQQAKSKADVVIVQAHMGGEGINYQHVTPGTQTFLGENRGDAIKFSHAMIDAGADIVIGHSPHVLRGMEFYKGHLIAYSLGNFVGYHALALNGPEAISMILRVTLRADGSFVSAKMVPIKLVSPGLPELDAKHQAIPLVRSLTQADFPDTGAQITDTGAIKPRA